MRKFIVSSGLRPNLCRPYLGCGKLRVLNQNLRITGAGGSPLTRAMDACFLTAFNHANMEYHTCKQTFEPVRKNIGRMVLPDCRYMNAVPCQDKSCSDMCLQHG
jgi:hypothetical protein